MRTAIQEEDEQMSEQREAWKICMERQRAQGKKTTKDTKEIQGLTKERPSLLEKNSSSSEEKECIGSKGKLKTTQPNEKLKHPLTS